MGHVRKLPAMFMQISEVIMARQVLSFLSTTIEKTYQSSGEPHLRSALTVKQVKRTRVHDIFDESCK